jgi:cell division protein FtsB
MPTRRPKVPRAQHSSGTGAAQPPVTGQHSGPDGQASHAAGAGHSRHHVGSGARPGTGSSPASRGVSNGTGVPAHGRSSAPADWLRRMRLLAGGGADGASAVAAGDSPEEELRPVPARAFSGRMLALAVVLLTITVLLAPSVRTYLQQRADITALQQDIEAKKQAQSDLKNDLSRWSDPAYIKQQARDRVNMMMPGETGYWVYDGSGSSAAAEDPATGATGTSSSSPENLPWVDGLWQSIQRSATE